MSDQLQKIMVVTGSRAEYGLLTPLLSALNDAQDFELQLVVTGTHLSNFHGFTLKHILADGFEPVAEVHILEEEEDSDIAVAKATAKALEGIAAVIELHQPDLMIVLGDRYEIFAAAQAALLMKIPIAHIHGGEVTEGAMDDSIRHAITKLASVHFVAAEVYRQRVIQMGEPPAMVMNVGAPGLELVQQLSLLSKEQLAEDLGITFEESILLVTFHPVTWNADQKGGLDELFRSLERREHTTIIWTAPNADSTGRAVYEEIFAWSQCRANVYLFSNLGSLRYLSIMQIADAVIGNSSSGIIEAPFLGVPTVNIGSRQQGRLMANSVFQAQESRASVDFCLEQAQNFKNRSFVAQSLYGEGATSKKIVDFLRTLDFKQLHQKQFFDVNMSSSAN